MLVAGMPTAHTAGNFVRGQLARVCWRAGCLRWGELGRIDGDCSFGCSGHEALKCHSCAAGVGDGKVVVRVGRSLEDSWWRLDFQFQSPIWPFAGEADAFGCWKDDFRGTQDPGAEQKGTVQAAHQRLVFHRTQGFRHTPACRLRTLASVTEWPGRHSDAGQPEVARWDVQT